VCGLGASDKWYVLSNGGEPMSTRRYVISSDKWSCEPRRAGKHRGREPHGKNREIIPVYKTP
jgi:hypothetical protein